MKGRHVPYSAAELAWIEQRKEQPRRQLHAAFCEAFGRSDVSFDNFKALCTRRGWKTGRTGRIEPGATPHNKGVKGWRAPGSEKGWFRKGERRGKANRLYKPIGTERVNRDGYLERKVNDDMPLQARWRAVHLIEWERVNGPVPDGHCLKCLDGDKSNTDPSNWALVPRAMLPRLAGRWSLGYDEAPPELRPTILAAARLQHAARERRKGDKT
ncbi:HNH endonuclease signature motif containing protein [Meridianimarinicoccus sp. RP-17]|uniref:HNH endonuclease signature motif containing protein n=1 Tax=Meridianimarinicoccus zhengii TaxID=2056810 RepID=UPI000DADFF34|nr:HNH endonuclease signature motif containing protein [Phycocomes zhengii]